MWLSHNSVTSWERSNSIEEEVHVVVLNSIERAVAAVDARHVGEIEALTACDSQR